MKKISLFILFVCFSLLSLGQEKEKTAPTEQPKLTMLVPGDSLQVFVGSYQQKYIIHEIKGGQTLYSLARFYGLKFKDLMAYNRELTNRVIEIGQKVKVPISHRILTRKKDKDFVDSLFVPVFYEVKPRETMYTISRTYFRVEPKLLMQNNEKTTSTLRNGESLLVGWMSIYGVPDSVRAFTGPNAAFMQGMEKNKQTFAFQSEVKKEISEDGVAFWDYKSNNSNDSGLFALHRTAKTNTVIRVRNPMNNRHVFVKVIGQIPDVGYDQRIKIVLSAKAAKALGALNPRFHVKMIYFK